MHKVVGFRVITQNSSSDAPNQAGVTAKKKRQSFSICVCDK
ncbi:MAG: hypothetical protein WA823_14355 [Candidatus Acidiferrales bacterium]